MLIRKGTDRDEHVDRQLASCLAGVAGALNAAAFYAVGFFSANMTGNVSTLSDHLALGDWIPGLFYLGIVVIFILGAVVATALINDGQRRGIRGIYAYTILLESILLALLGIEDLFAVTSQHVPVLVLGLAFLMGLQNAAVTHISDARVRTTHISGMATDLGIEIAIAMDTRLSREQHADAASNRRKLKLHLYTILSFLAGGMIGVVGYRSFGALLWLAAASFLFAIAVVGIRRARAGTIR